MDICGGGGSNGSKNRGLFDVLVPYAGIFKQSMGARYRVGIGLSYRPERLHSLAEFVFYGINSLAP